MALYCGLSFCDILHCVSREPINCYLSLYSPVGVLTQGGGVFSTFVSSFYLQFSQDGRQWYTYKELVTDARPRAKVRPQPGTTQFDHF